MCIWSILILRYFVYIDDLMIDLHYQIYTFSNSIVVTIDNCNTGNKQFINSITEICLVILKNATCAKTKNSLYLSTYTYIHHYFNIGIDFETNLQTKINLTKSYMIQISIISYLLLDCNWLDYLKRNHWHMVHSWIWHQLDFQSSHLPMVSFIRNKSTCTFGLYKLGLQN